MKISSTCSVCGKPLSDPVSVEVGMGPVCRVNKKLSDMGDKTGNIFSNRAEYEWWIDKTTGDNILCIEDKCGLKSVTNDIENIFDDILEKGISPSDYPIMYKDSMGIWDGIRILYVEGRVKIEFFSLTEKEFSKAKEKLLTMKK